MALLLAAVLSAQVFSPVAYAVNTGDRQSSVEYHEIDAENHAVENLSVVAESYFYIYADENFSYCAQMIPNGKTL